MIAATILVVALGASAPPGLRAGDEDHAQETAGVLLGGAVGGFAGGGVGYGITALRCAPRPGLGGLLQSSCGIEPTSAFIVGIAAGMAIGAVTGAIGGYFLGAAADDANAVH